jgi:hypothetical protein
MKLDVGCGNYPQGDVNCDLYITDVGHRGTKGKSLNLKRIKNFVLCDSQQLPFKEECFDEVVSRGVIEHVDDPWLHIKELVRVSCCAIYLRCPWRISDRLHHPNPYNRHYFSKRWFIEAINKLHCYGSVSYTFPPWLVLFTLVHLEINIRKR